MQEVVLTPEQYAALRDLTHVQPKGQHRREDAQRRARNKAERQNRRKARSR